MSGVVQDVRYAIRSLRKWPGFTLTAAFTLMLGIGANISIFSFVDSVWLEAMGVPRPAEVVRLYTSDAAGHGRHTESSYPDYLDLQAQARSLKGLAALERRGAFFDNGTLNKLVLANIVSENFFSVLDVHAALGRIFTSGDFQDPQARPILVSYQFWRRELHSDPSLVGHNLVIDSQQAYLVGVLPRDFRGGQALQIPDLWIPEPSWVRFQPPESRRLKNRGFRDFELYGRLAPGYSLARANAELELISIRLEKQFPETNAGHDLLAIPLANTFDFGEEIGPMLLALAAFVLLIACANFANLLLARSEFRRPEIATRLALGAARSRILRQLLIENAVIVAIACAAALLAASALNSAIPALVPQGNLPLTISADVNMRTISFAAVCALLCALLPGLGPALRTSRLSLSSAVNRQAALNTRERTPIRNLLVIAQVAISMILVITSGLLVRSIYHAYSADPGFDAHQQMLIANLAGISPNERREARARIEQLPGVISTAASYRVPFGMSYGGATRLVFLPSSAGESARRGETVHYTAVTDRYFETLGTRILSGRPIDRHDLEADAKVVVVNQKLASALWPNQDPIGQLLKLNRPFSDDSTPEPWTYHVVGVAENGKYNELNEPTMPYMFVPLGVQEEGEVAISIRTATSADALARPVQEILRSINPGMPMLEFTTMREHMKESVSDERLTARLVGAMGGLGLMLAAIGLYGLMAFLVGQRTQEIGIRMALGAVPQQIFKMMISQSLWLAGIGIVLGCLGASFAARLLHGLLYGVRATDFATYTIAIALLLVVTLTAAAFPSIQAMRLDPLAALRQE